MQRLLRTVLLLTAATATLICHPGHGDPTLASGFVHPFTGLDHLLAMLMVGLLARRHSVAPRWAVPTAFVGAMTIGMLIGAAGVMGSLVEVLVALTVLALGVLAAWRQALPIATVALIAAIAGLLHGQAHAGAIAAQASDLPFVAGALIATVVLHACGFACACLLLRGVQTPLIRLAGCGVAAVGLALTIQAIGAA